MKENKKITVCAYGGSSPHVKKEFLDAAFKLGEMCAKAGASIVCGGGKTGMMAALIDGCQKENGHATGVLPKFMIDNNWHNDHLDELVVTADMHARKKRMVSDADFAVAMPGGIGTLDELCEIITWKQLGIFKGEVIIMNIDGYYDLFIEMLKYFKKEHFFHHKCEGLFTVISSVEETAKMISEKNA